MIFTWKSSRLLDQWHYLDRDVGKLQIDRYDKFLNSLLKFLSFRLLELMPIKVRIVDKGNTGKIRVTGHRSKINHRNFRDGGKDGYWGFL